MQSLVNDIKAMGLSVCERITPVLKESKFRETGMLTPEEFVAAGDHLVSCCPTWSWARGDPDSVKEYLPRDKQFLLTKNVPCSKRCRDLEYNGENEKIIEEDGAGEGWVETHAGSTTTAQDIQKSETSRESASGNTGEEEEADDDDAEVAVDMDDFIGGLDEDAGAVVKQPEEENGVLATRTYDLSITYDNYYRTPRLWLTGYDENHRPLKTKELYEDISQDFAKKTVTVEPHPHLGAPSQASVHPCRHAQAMKNLIQMVVDGGGSLEVHMYLIVFLKFVQAVIPTIEYDYTTNFNMS